MQPQGTDDAAAAAAAVAAAALGRAADACSSGACLFAPPMKVSTGFSSSESSSPLAKSPKPRTLPCEGFFAGAFGAAAVEATAVAAAGCARVRGHREDSTVSSHRGRGRDCSSLFAHVHWSVLEKGVHGGVDVCGRTERGGEGVHGDSPPLNAVSSAFACASDAPVMAQKSETSAIVACGRRQAQRLLQMALHRVTQDVDRTCAHVTNACDTCAPPRRPG